MSGDNWAYYDYKEQIENDNKEVFPIMSHDLCCHYFKEDFAELMFPIYFHGSGKSMWYSQFIGYKLYPNKCLVFNKILIKNTEHEPHQDHENFQFSPDNEIVKKFAEIIKDKYIKEEFLSWDHGFIKAKNKEIYLNEINKDIIIFDKSKLNNLIFL